MNTPTIRIFVLDVPEFSSLVSSARQKPSCRVSTPLEGYHMIESSAPVEFRRKELGLKPAVWYGLFTGGLRGHIETFDRDLVRIVPAR